jgi:diguanylate cyclase (GGDEF)-like protein
MVRQLEGRGRQNAILSEMRELLQACSTMADLPPVISSGLEKLLPEAAGELFLVSPSRVDMECVCRWGDAPDRSEENAFAPDACWAIRLGHVHLVEDARQGPLCQHVRQPLSGLPAEASAKAGGYLCVPLTAKGEVLGLIHLRYRSAAVAASSKPRPLAELRELAVALSEILSLSVANVRLRETLSYQSIRDPLTGLYNRRYMEDALTREIARAARHQTQTGIIMCDIDNFKRFNDTFGHAAGDAVLVELARFFRTTTRIEDVVCRYGGEEFMLILPECGSIEDVRRRADQIRQGAREMRVPFHGQTLAVALSMGVAVCPGHGTDIEALLRVADEALYNAKQQGRDRVVMGQCPATPGQSTVSRPPSWRASSNLGGS